MLLHTMKGGKPQKHTSDYRAALVLPGGYKPRKSMGESMYEVQKHAENVCDYINQEVLAGEDAHVSVLDLLDTLATFGLTLVDDPAAASTYAYQDMLRPPTTDS